MTARSLRARIRSVHDRLWAEYGDGSVVAHGSGGEDPLDGLVRTILSQHTSDLNSDRAFADLKRRFPTWESVLAADVSELEEAIRSGGLAAQKAPRIRAILEEIRRERGCLDLSNLDAMGSADAVAHLTRFHGVGRKTAACVLLFSMGRPVFPVDVHCLRTARRLALVPPDCDANQAHDLLDAMVPNDLKLGLHLGLVRHGRLRCRPTAPRCEGCPVRRYCSYPDVA